MADLKRVKKDVKEAQFEHDEWVSQVRSVATFGAT
jgi:hypothetical protein